MSHLGKPPECERPIDSLRSFAKPSIDEFLADSPFHLAAALSFYTLLSLSPLVLMVVSTAGFIWGEEAVRTQLVSQIQQLIGPAGADTVKMVLTNVASRARISSRWRSAGRRARDVDARAGIVTVLFGATTVFAQLQTSLDQIWNIKAVASRRVVWSLIRMRLLSLALVLAVGFVLLVSLVLSAALAALHGQLSDLMPQGGALWRGVNLVVSLAVIGLLIGVIYRVLPDVRIGWRYVWQGALVTAQDEACLATSTPLVMTPATNARTMGSAFLPSDRPASTRLGRRRFVALKTEFKEHTVDLMAMRSALLRSLGPRP